LIQVCADITQTKTLEREIKALLSGSDKLHCNQLIILTLSEEEELNKDGKIIHVIPIWKWLLRK